MIARGLKKLAAEYDMKVSSGVAYGSMRGYAATLSEGSGYKRLVLTTRILQPEKLGMLQVQTSRRELAKEFRVQKLKFGENHIDIVFLDNPGTIKRIRAFVDWFFPLLEESGATKADVCVECGTAAVGGRWKLINGVAYYMHETCAQKILRQAEAEQENAKQESQGSYLSGLLGALLGAALGALVWAGLLYAGYLASIVGLLIGFLAIKGYDLLKGRQGKSKLPVILVAIVFGVVLGTFGGYGLQLAGMISSGELPNWTYSEIPVLFEYLFADSDFLGAAGQDILMGLFFAALGTYGILIKAGKQIQRFKMTDLE